VAKKKDIPPGTLDAILVQSGESLSNFLLAMGGKYAKTEKQRLKKQSRD